MTMTFTLIFTKLFYLHDEKEFVPHGRTVFAKHPTKIYNKGFNNSASENSLLYKLTNFAIKDESLLEAKEADEQEMWCVREVYYRGDDGKFTYISIYFFVIFSFILAMPIGTNKELNIKKTGE